MSLPLVFPPTTAQVTKSGDTMLGLAVHKRQLDIIKYLVTECSDSVNGVQSLYISAAICGVCEHMYTCMVHCMHSIVYSHSHTHLLHTVSTLSRQILELSIHRGELDFIKYLVNKLSVNVNGEFYDSTDTTTHLLIFCPDKVGSVCIR